MLTGSREPHLAPPPAGTQALCTSYSPGYSYWCVTPHHRDAQSLPLLPCAQPDDLRCHAGSAPPPSLPRPLCPALAAAHATAAPPLSPHLRRSFFPHLCLSAAAASPCSAVTAAASLLQLVILSFYLVLLPLVYDIRTPAGARLSACNPAKKPQETKRSAVRPASALLVVVPQNTQRSPALRPFLPRRRHPHPAQQRELTHASRATPQAPSTRPWALCCRATSSSTTTCASAPSRAGPRTASARSRKGTSASSVRRRNSHSPALSPSVCLLPRGSPWKLGFRPRSSQHVSECVLFRALLPFRSAGAVVQEMQRAQTLAGANGAAAHSRRSLRRACSPVQAQHTPSSCSAPQPPRRRTTAACATSAS